MCEVGSINHQNGFRSDHEFEKTLSNPSTNSDLNLFFSKRTHLDKSQELIYLSKNNRRATVPWATNRLYLPIFQGNKKIGDYIRWRVTWNWRVLYIYINRSFMYSRNWTFRWRGYAWIEEGRWVSGFHRALV